jgi:branched-chain amino acid transport system permease protein
MVFAYIANLLAFAGIYGIVGISLNVAFGYTGLANLGHAALFGIGAYVSALLALGLGMPFWAALLVAGLFAALIGWLLAWPTARLRGDYLALATLGFGFIVESVFKNWMDVTRGPLGIPGIPKPELFGFVFSSTESYLLIVAAFLLVTYLVVKRIVDSPFGRVLKAIREDELAAQSLGKHTHRYKALALAFSGFFAGLAGALFAHYITFIDPSSFTIFETILAFSIVIVGGMGSLEGSLIGAALITFLPEPLRFIGFPSAVIGPARQLIYAALLIIIILKRPQGLRGEYAFGSSKASEQVRKHAASVPSAKA